MSQEFEAEVGRRVALFIENWNDAVRERVFVVRAADGRWFDVVVRRAEFDELFGHNHVRFTFQPPGECPACDEMRCRRCGGSLHDAYDCEAP